MQGIKKHILGSLLFLASFGNAQNVERPIIFFEGEGTLSYLSFSNPLNNQYLDEYYNNLKFSIGYGGSLGVNITERMSLSLRTNYTKQSNASGQLRLNRPNATYTGVLKDEIENLFLGVKLQFELPIDQYLDILVNTTLGLSSFSNTSVFISEISTYSANSLATELGAGVLYKLDPMISVYGNLSYYFNSISEYETFKISTASGNTVEPLTPWLNQSRYQLSFGLRFNLYSGKTDQVRETKPIEIPKSTDDRFR